jgi:hypothetical protein
MASHPVSHRIGSSRGRHAHRACAQRCSFGSRCRPADFLVTADGVVSSSGSGHVLILLHFREQAPLKKVIDIIFLRKVDCWPLKGILNESRRFFKSRRRAGDVSGAQDGAHPDPRILEEEAGPPPQFVSAVRHHKGATRVY